MVSTPVLAIAFWAAIFSAVSYYLNRTVGSREKVKQLQKEVNDFQKKFEKATKEKDEKELAKLKLQDAEMMGKMQEMLFLPLKAMIVILPVFFIAVWALEHFYPSFLITLPFAIHVNEILSLNVMHSSVYGPRGFFIVISIVVGLALQGLESLYNTVKKPSNAPAAGQK